ncbi:MAG: hypothetical protein KGJ60_09580 [Verrucomicrobiota bacterium]|nr:hypothetical protein [Verrucomicrobiota bacterium]
MPLIGMLAGSLLGGSYGNSNQSSASQSGYKVNIGGGNYLLWIILGGGFLLFLGLIVIVLGGRK